MNTPPVRVARFSRTSVIGVAVALVAVLVLVVMPYYVPLGASRQVTSLFIYIVLATSWNLLAGFGGMVSIGQQAYIGLGAYGLVTLVSLVGVEHLLAIPLAAIGCAIVAVPISYAAFRLTGGYFAVGTWVIAEVARLLIIRVPALGGGSGMSVPPMAGVDRDLQIAIGYWAALAVAVVTVMIVVLVVRSRLGLALTAVRDEPVAAATSGVDVVRAKRIVFVLAAACAGAGGALLATSTLTVQPSSVFSVNWTATMIFIVVIGGVGSIEGPIIGAVVYWGLQVLLADYGELYLIGLGVLAIVIVLWVPGGIWGLITRRRRVSVFPVSYRLVPAKTVPAD
ncbi:branched-chain amino acid ABC transporter permease [Microbacterium gorillae]|uniref:branched-chain amino acid ABC transporter permease n=1 Tax=Microbacterium gorillae TaxID=1231063 RepID=UPI00058AF76F|nr:branched-chain amino acid ABC transporter permease [Microbacterium gorillae]